MKNINGLEKKQSVAENNTLFSRSWNLAGLVGHDLEVTVRSEETNMMKQFQKSRNKERNKINEGGGNKK